MNPILIYSNSITKRLQYVLHFFWENNYILTNSIAELDQYDGPKFSYTKEKIVSKSLWIASDSLLSKSNIEPQNIQIQYWNELPIFFSGNGDIPFDIFAASFYLITRYEEYLPHRKDQYGRFDAANALAFREDFLQLPLVDLWFLKLEKILLEKFANYSPTKSKFQYIPTFDIDMPYAFSHRSWYVQTGIFLKNILNGKKENVQKQIHTILGKAKDPFDTFDFLQMQMRKYVLKPIFFFLVAKKNSSYDKNPSPSNPSFQKLIQQQSKIVDVGIHPSWQSSDANSILSEEKNFLETTIGKKITKSRQHYLRMLLPKTYQELISLGIEEDFSMGYGNIDGFRASTSKPFYWFDLSKNESTKLKIHPFCWMDATAIHHTKDTPEKTSEKLQYYRDIIDKVNGQMITIMHNNYFAELPTLPSMCNIIIAFWSDLNTMKRLENPKI